jgi:hypothetical protein
MTLALDNCDSLKKRQTLFDELHNRFSFGGTASANTGRSFPVTYQASPQTIVVSWQSQRHFEARTAEMRVDTADGRIGTRFPRLRFPRHDRLLRSILLLLEHRTGMGCARTFWSLDSPLTIPSFPGPFSDHNSAADLRWLAVPTRVTLRELIHSRWSVFGGYVISTECMQISKSRSAPGARLSEVLRCSSTTQ